MCFSYHSSVLVTLLSTLTYYGWKEMVLGTSALLAYLLKSIFPIFFLASFNSLFLILNKYVFKEVMTIYFPIRLRNHNSVPRLIRRLDSTLTGLPLTPFFPGYSDPSSKYSPLCTEYGFCSWHLPTTCTLCPDHFLIADHSVSAAWNALSHVFSLSQWTRDSRSNLDCTFPLCSFPSSSQLESHSHGYASEALCDSPSCLT